MLGALPRTRDGRSRSKPARFCVRRVDAEVGEADQPGERLDVMLALAAEVLVGDGLRVVRDRFESRLGQRCGIHDGRMVRGRDRRELPRDDRFELVRWHAGAQRPCLVRPGALSACVGAADRDHHALAQRGVDPRAGVDREQSWAEAQERDDVGRERSRGVRAAGRRISGASRRLLDAFTLAVSLARAGCQLPELPAEAREARDTPGAYRARRRASRCRCANRRSSRAPGPIDRAQPVAGAVGATP